VTASKYPFPTVCADKQSTDWFSSISRTLRWNEREKQKSFVVVEEDRAAEKGQEAKQKDKHKAESRMKAHADVHDEEEDETSEEEEFDIDE
jgi:NAD+ kinase